MSIKERVLELLEQSKGKSVSGNKIATSLDVSRSAVWKAVNQLREEGYSINAGTNRGYCLTSDNDKMSEPSIKKYLRTKALGQNIDVFKTIDSTNSFAKSLAQLNAAHGHVVIAEQQTDGRGRMGRHFHSPNCQGIYMSVILRPKLPIEQALNVTACAAVAACEAIEKICAEEGAQNISCQIKWVNDVYISGKKACGILTEAAVGIEQGGLDYVVIGFGVNVNNYNFPDELKETATSLRAEVGESVSRAKLAAEILNILEEKIGTIGDRSFLEEYRRRSILTGKTVDIENNGITERFECVGIDDLGKLIVRRRSGEELTLSSGTVKIVNG